MIVGDPHTGGPYFMAVGITKNGDTAFTDIADTRKQRWSAEIKAQTMQVKKINLYSLIDGVEIGPLLTTGILKENNTFEWPGLAWFHISPDVKPDVIPNVSPGIIPDVKPDIDPMSIPDHIHVIASACDNVHILPIRGKIPDQIPDHIHVADNDFESPSP